MKNNNINFLESLILGCNLKINIFLENTNSSVCTKDFFNNYKISNFWKGKFFIKRLIKKVFKYKLHKTMIWDNDFWDKVTIDVYNSKINYSDSSLDDFRDNLEKNMKASRLNDVIKYTEMLKKNVNLGNPLYITSECLSLLGANLPNNKFYILDGSRRLASYVLADINPEILVIDVK